MAIQSIHRFDNVGNLSAHVEQFRTIDDHIVVLFQKELLSGEGYDYPVNIASLFPHRTSRTVPGVRLSRRGNGVKAGEGFGNHLANTVPIEQHRGIKEQES